MSSNLCVGDWMKLRCGDRVTEVDGRHEGRVQAILHSSIIRVRWNDTGWISDFQLGDNDLVNLTRQPRARLYALLSTQGTACHETVLLAHEYTAEARARIEADIDPSNPDAPVPGTWTDCTENDALQGREG